MRILQIGKYYYPYRGGMETVLQQLAEGLVQSGNEVTVFSSSETRKSGWENINGVDVLRSGTYGKFASQPLTISLPKLILENQKKFDLINVHSPNPLVELALLGIDRSIPLVVTYHSDIVRQRFLKHLYHPIFKSLLHRADKIIAASPQLIEHSPLLSNFQSQCDVIPFGLDEKQFQLNAETKAHAAKIRLEHGPYVIFIGRLVGYKGVDVLLEAAKNISAKVLVIGEGPLKEELEQKAYGLLNVQFLGEVENVLPYLAGSELLVLPSVTTAEAFGMVLLEAMACAKPIVSSRLPTGISYVNRDGETGIQTEPGNPQALSSAINKILKDEKLKKQMGEAALARFQKHFSLKKFVDSYERLYHELLVSPVKRIVNE